MLLKESNFHIYAVSADISASVFSRLWTIPRWNSMLSIAADPGSFLFSLHGMVKEWQELIQ